MSGRRTLVLLAAVIGVACVTRLGAVQNAQIDFDADEAIVGLMAARILHAESWPVFYAGQGYLGALEAWTAALVFLVLGEAPETLRIAPFSYTLAFLITQYFLLKRFFDFRAVALILLWTALGTPFLNLWSVKARGGFAEVLFLGSLFLLLFHRARRDGYNNGSSLWCLGLLAGFGYFVNPVIGSVMLPPLLLLARQTIIDWKSSGSSGSDRDHLVAILLFRHHSGLSRGMFLFLGILGVVFAGLALLVAVMGDIRADYPFRVRLRNGTRLVSIAVAYFAVLHGSQFLSLSRDVITRRRDRLRHWWNNSASGRILFATVAGIIVLPLVGEMVAWLTDHGGYGRPLSLAPMIAWPGNARLVFWELLPAVLGYSGSISVILSIVFVLSLGAVMLTHRVSRREELLLFGGVTISTIVLVTTSSYTVDVSVTRYLIPLLVSLPATVYVLGKMFQQSLGIRDHSSLLWLIPTTVIATNAIVGPASLFSQEKPVDVMDVVIRRLESLNVRAVMGDYWTVYPIAFLSRGRIIVAPMDGIDRFPSVSQSVKRTGPDAYVFGETASSLHSLRQSLEASNIRPEKLSAGLKPGPVIYVFRLQPSRGTTP